MRPFSCLLICAVFGLSYSQQSNTSLDDLIKNIFNTNENGGTSPEPAQPQVINPRPSQEKQTDNYKPCGYERVCVPRFLCNNDTLITDGRGIIDIRVDGEDCDYLELCCDVSQKTNVAIIDPVPPSQHVGCGYRNPDGVGFRIIGDNDNEAQFGEFPWMVAILREEPAPEENLNLYECGGALIAPNVVLTAAHCVQNRQASQLIVRAGEWDTQTRNEVIPDQDRRVQEIIVHEQFNKGSLYNDIALLIMETSFEWQGNVRPICLPPAGTNFDLSRCFATGWGKNNFGRNGTYQVILKKIDLPIMPRDKCVTNLRSTRLGKFFELHESFVCAGGEKGKDTCKGDGGSPLVCPIPGQKDRYFQAGIVAWGLGCGEENVPGVYANVAHLRQWIDVKLASKGINSSFFTP